MTGSQYALTGCHTDAKKEDKMKLFKRLMAGAMAIAMLSAYTVALAAAPTTTDPTTVSGGKTATVSGVGSYAGDMQEVFVMKLPTAASVADSLAFTVDPQELLKNSKPANADGSSGFGTVIFKTVSGSGNTATTIYTNQSEPLKVISMSSVDVTVNMLATLSDSKMKLYEGAPFDLGSGFPANNTTDHLYLGVKVDTISGGTSANSGGTRIISGGAAVTDTKTISPLGAKKATVLKAVSDNFEATADGNGFAVISGGLSDDSWNYVEYTVMGASNPADDLWQIEGLTAPNLTIKWMIDSAKKITSTIPAPVDPADTATWKGQLDKDAYAAGETVTVFIQPVDSTKKVKSVTFNYVSTDTKDPKVTGKEVVLKADMVGPTVDGTTVPTVTNGVYAATFTMPSNMAKAGSSTGTGTGAVAYKAPTYTVTLA